MKILALLKDFFDRKIRGKIAECPPHVLGERGKDISLSLDYVLHEEITRFLQTHFQFPVLSEEEQTPLDFRQYEEYVWILDPLDGSMNYSRSIPINDGKRQTARI